MEIPSENCPWWHPEHGVMCGALPVSWWGAFLDERPRLPTRWRTPSTGTGEVEPTGFEFECYVHLIRHERARLDGTELSMLADCLGFDPVPPDAVQAAADGNTLIGWCPGISWHWDDENRPAHMAVKFAARQGGGK